MALALLLNAAFGLTWLLHFLRDQIRGEMAFGTGPDPIVSAIIGWLVLFAASLAYELFVFAKSAIGGPNRGLGWVGLGVVAIQVATTVRVAYLVVSAA